MIELMSPATRDGVHILGEFEVVAQKRRRSV
jgi:hypothetical protein